MYVVKADDIVQHYITELTVCFTVHGSKEGLFGQMGNDREIRRLATINQKRNGTEKNAGSAPYR